MSAYTLEEVMEMVADDVGVDVAPPFFIEDIEDALAQSECECHLNPPCYAHSGGAREDIDEALLSHVYRYVAGLIFGWIV